MRPTALSRPSRRIEPIIRSANAFCQGLRGALITSFMPNDLVRRETRCRRSHRGRGPSTAWRLFGEGFHHLLRGPFGARMFRDSEMKYLPPLMFQHEKHKQNPQADSRYSEEADADVLPSVVL